MTIGSADGVTTTDSSVATAARLRERISDCERLLAGATRFANRRWSVDANSFKDNDDSTGVHVVNSATALMVIGRSSGVFDRDSVSAFDNLSWERISGRFKDLHKTFGWSSKEQDDWSPYTTALVLSAIATNAREDIAQSTPTGFAAILSGEVEKLLTWLIEWSEQDKGDFDHPFFSFSALNALTAVFSNETLRETCGSSADLPNSSMLRILYRFQREFYAQFSYQRGGMPQHLDPSNLILSLCALVQHGREMAEMPEDVVEAGLEVAFELQQPETGQWDTTTPLLGVKSGRVGCSSVELAVHLLSVARPVARFERHFAGFERLFLALRRGYDPSLLGWPVDIRRTGSARQTWYSFYVYEFLSLFRDRAREYAADSVLRHFRYHPGQPKVKWDGISNFGQFKQQIESSVFEPRDSGESGAASSLILFGPPGTGKTTISHALAGRLSWGMIEIGPGDFLLNGLDGIFARGDLIFERLMLLEDVVVLFDEVDELVSSRDGGTEAFSRILTTYMLPWLQRLRDKNSVIFIFATNHIERFDSAIRRVGRFDLVLPIGPPIGSDRLEGLCQRLARPADGELKVISAEAPEQATLGDIIRAIRKAEAAGETGSAPVLARLDATRLTVSVTEWESFRLSAGDYSSSGDAS